MIGESVEGVIAVFYTPDDPNGHLTFSQRHRRARKPENDLKLLWAVSHRRLIAARADRRRSTFERCEPQMSVNITATSKTMVPV